MITVAIAALIAGISVYAWKQAELSIQDKIHSTEKSRYKEKLANAEWSAKGKDKQIAQLEHTIEELEITLAQRMRKEVV